MDTSQPLRCIAEIACIGAVGATFLGWLPVILASIASFLAAVHYGVWIWDRFHKRGNTP